MSVIIGNGTQFQDSSGNVKNLATEMAKIGTGGSGATALSGLSDVDVATTPPSTGQVLKYNGTKWTPQVDNTGSGGSTVTASGTNGYININGTDTVVYNDSTITGEIGTLSNLQTSVKSDLVSAINSGFSQLNSVTSDPVSPVIGQMWFRSDL